MTQRRCSLAKDTTGWWIASDGSGRLTDHFRRDIATPELGSGSVRIRVEYSGLNYKDALALTGQPGVLRTTPLIPGIDAAGVVEESSDPSFPAGTRVVVTGFGYGEARHGGLATTLIAEPEHLIALPPSLTTRHAAALGTAGITASLAVAALRDHQITPTSHPHPIAVTGAAGGVGSLAVFLLASHGFSVTAITGRSDEADYLQMLGASTVVSRQEILSLPERPLLTEAFAGVVDQAGGQLLARLIASTASNGVIAASGLAGGSDLPTSVLPFILRGVTLVGVNSVYQSLAVRQALWEDMATREFPWEDIITEIPLAEAANVAPRVIAGATRGRVVVALGS
jgi:acrylyl-CoA reductase (NADPH)